ncbi:heparinase II/III family protein [Parafrankia soli]|uniref:heparinase II/III family protein n=1 Tax=Parafrankia soli TaxID=2599596 RepID=UPI001F519F5B|nr:heparinase II/III family protein [Parafrankia soli]
MRTTRGLRPDQIAARARLRTQRALFARYPAVCGALLRGGTVAGVWPAGFVPFDGRVNVSGATATEIVRGRLTLLGATRVLHPPEQGPEQADWCQRDAPLLWRYHLHYWDWAWALDAGDAGAAEGTPDGATDPGPAQSRFAALYLSWRSAATIGRGVAWSPYVVSLRAWTLCALSERLTRRTPAEATIRQDLGTHRSFLRAHLETDVGGNHLLKNYKALAGLAVVAGDEPDRRRWVDAVCREVERQVLADGGHYERAPAYHCQVLADLGDLAGLVAATGAAVPGELTDAIAAMQRWLTSVLAPDGTVPLLNDGFPVSAAAVQELLVDPACTDPADPAGTVGASPAGPAGPAGTVAAGNTAAPCVLLADSGLAVLRKGPWQVLADVGQPCPDELPAHAHADTLSFLLWYNGVPILVDTGTSTYEPGPTRDAERGTAAHSTVIVDGVDSTEVWGTFRAGRRARPHLVDASDHPDVVELTAGHDGYRHLPGRPVHWRTWRVEESGVRLVDRITGTGWHRIELVLTFAPGADVVVRPARPAGAGTPGARPNTEELLVAAVGAQRLVVRTDGTGHWRVRRSWRATRWGETASAPTTVFTVEGRLPIQLSTELRPAP